MAEINDDEIVKLIAFYLPQFHSIPENDFWWGKGFTEWTNVKKAKPLFDGHYQPKIPYEKNYYNLLDKGVMERQANMAKEYGIWGFCYYHYWFKDGKKLLEKPIENMLINKEVKIPFCLSWANENWTRNWDGGNKEIIIEQDYGSKKDWKKHFDYLLDFFRDDRYITIDGHPLFIIYKPQLIHDLKEMLLYWNELAKKSGLNELCFAIQYPSWFLEEDFDMGLFKYYIKFEPTFSGITMNKKNSISVFIYKIRQFLYRKYRISIKRKKQNNYNGLRIYNYDKTWRKIINGYTNKNMIEGAFTAWDNTPRNKKGIVFHQSTPEKFGKYMALLVNKVRKKKNDRMIFINAWNEWAEGAYLEPDEKYKYDYLENIKTIIKDEQ